MTFKSRQAGLGAARFVTAWFGLAGMDSQGEAGSGKERIGRRGSEWHGAVRSGWVWRGRRGEERRV
jgi:hypothetical protein